MRRQQRAFASSNVGDKDIRVCALRFFLRIDDELPVLGPDRIGVQLVGRRFRRDVLGLAHQCVEHVNLVRGRSFRLYHAGKKPPIGRPDRVLFGHFARLGYIDDLARLRRDEEDVPLLVAVIVGLISDPFPIRRPCGTCLPLIADGELRRPTALRGHQPQIVAPSDVRNKNDGLSVR